MLCSRQTKNYGILAFARIPFLRLKLRSEILACLAAQTSKDPHYQGQQGAEEEAGDNRKRKRKISAAIAKVSRQSADREIEAVQSQEEKPDDDESETGKDEGAAEVGHRLGCHAQFVGGVEQIHRTAWFGEDADRLRQRQGALPHAIQGRIQTCEHEDGTFRELSAEIEHQGDAISAGQVDIAQDQVRGALAYGGERLVRVSGRTGVKAVVAEDCQQGFGDDGFVVHDQNAHRGLGEWLVR